MIDPDELWNAISKGVERWSDLRDDRLFEATSEIFNDLVDAGFVAPIEV